MKRLLTISLFLVMTACGDVGIAALGSLATAGMAYGTKVVVQDTEDAAIWRNEHRMIVGQCEAKLMAGVDDLTKDGFDKLLKRCEVILMFSADQQPQIFAERMLERYRKAKGGK